VEQRRAAQAGVDLRALRFIRPLKENVHREAEEALPDRQDVHTSSPACLQSLPLQYPPPPPPPPPQQQQHVGWSLEEAGTAWDHTGSSWTDR
jgi:hypothetical protein